MSAFSKIKMKITCTVRTGVQFGVRKFRIYEVTFQGTFLGMDMSALVVVMGTLRCVFHWIFTDMAIPLTPHTRVGGESRQ